MWCCGAVSPVDRIHGAVNQGMRVALAALPLLPRDPSGESVLPISEILGPPGPAILVSGVAGTASIRAHGKGSAELEMKPTIWSM